MPRHGLSDDRCDRNDRGFWWDELSSLLFEPSSLPLELRIDIASHPHGWRTGGKLATDEGRDGPIVVREQLHDELWRLLRPLDPESRSDLIIRLCAWVGAEVGTKSMNRPLSAEEVHRLAAPGFNDIGAHTVTHPQLSLLDGAGQLARSKAAAAPARSWSAARSIHSHTLLVISTIPPLPPCTTVASLARVPPRAARYRDRSIRCACPASEWATGEETILHAG